MIYMISYDLNSPGQKYEELYEKIKEIGSWWHYLDSTWLVSTSLSASEIYSKIKSPLDNGDHILVFSLGKDYQGYLPQKAWDWIKENI